MRIQRLFAQNLDGETQSDFLKRSPQANERLKILIRGHDWVSFKRLLFGHKTNAPATLKSKLNQEMKYEYEQGRVKRFQKATRRISNSKVIVVIL